MESIYDGTWASGPPPAEYVDFVLMHEMQWSWEALRATPFYVRRYSYDMIQIGWQAEHDKIEEAKREANSHA